MTPGAATTAPIGSRSKHGDSDRFQLVAYLQLQLRHPQSRDIIEDLT